MFNTDFDNWLIICIVLVQLLITVLEDTSPNHDKKMCDCVAYDRRPRHKFIFGTSDHAADTGQLSGDKVVGPVQRIPRTSTDAGFAVISSKWSVDVSPFWFDPVVVSGVVSPLVGYRGYGVWPSLDCLFFVSICFDVVLLSAFLWQLVIIYFTIGWILPVVSPFLRYPCYIIYLAIDVLLLHSGWLLIHHLLDAFGYQQLFYHWCNLWW